MTALSNEEIVACKRVEDTLELLSNARSAFEAALKDDRLPLLSDLMETPDSPVRCAMCGEEEEGKVTLEYEAEADIGDRGNVEVPQEALDGKEGLNSYCTWDEGNTFYGRWYTDCGSCGKSVYFRAVAS